MKVMDCKKCKHCKRKAWSQYYRPGNYHPIGMSHVYHWCEKYQKRILDIKKCNDHCDI